MITDTKDNPDMIDEKWSMDESTSLIGIASISNVDNAKARWITVEPIILLIFIGAGSLTTIQSQYLQQRIATDTFNYTYVTDSNELCGVTNTSDPDYIVEQKIQQQTANWSLYLSICRNLPLIFSVIAIGKWSDIRGRKVGILVPLLGILVASSVYLIVIKFHLSMSLLYIAEVTHGLCGGTPLILSVSFAYLADITTKEQRTFRIVVIETCLVVSSGVSQIIVGYLIEAYGFDTPFYVSISCIIAAILYTILPRMLYESIEWRTGGGSFLSRMSRLFHGISDLFVYNEGNRRWRLLLLNVISFFITIVEWIVSVLTLYLIGQPFCWSSVLVGIFSAVSYCLIAIGTIVGSKVLGICLSDIWILYIGLMSAVAGWTVIGLAEDTAIVFLSSVIGCLQVLPFAITRSIISKSVTAREQGVAFSVLASVDSVSAFIGPIMYQGLYSRNIVLGNPGVPFFAAAGFGVLSGVFAVILHCGFLIRQPSGPKHV